MMFELWVRWRKPQESDWHAHLIITVITYNCDTNDHDDDQYDRSDDDMMLMKAKTGVRMD